MVTARQTVGVSERVSVGVEMGEEPGEETGEEMGEERDRSEVGVMLVRVLC